MQNQRSTRVGFVGRFILGKKVHDKPVPGRSNDLE